MVISKLFIKSTILCLILLIILYSLWYVRSALYPFIIGLFLAYLLNPLVCYLEGKGFKRVWAIILLYVLLFSIVIIGGSNLLTLLIRDLEYFARDLPQMIAHVDGVLTFIQSQYQNSELPYSLRLAIDEALLSMESDVQQFIGHIVHSIIDIVRNSIGLVITPILAFYLLHDWNEIKDELVLLLPNRWRGEFILFFRDVDKVLSGIIRGQLTVACIIGIFITIGLYALQVKFALIIGILAAIFDVIPYFGAIIGAAPAIMIAMLQSPWLTVKVIILFVLVQQIEGNIIHPKIIGENIGLHPLAVIFFVIVGGEIGGVLGMLLGVPLGAIGKVLIKHMMKVLL
ncbi:MAG: AI-2E family transporter [Sporomusaceae bacterium]|nr:AI-2E family transporter [Sporomusaceae bacterium]